MANMIYTCPFDNQQWQVVPSDQSLSLLGMSCAHMVCREAGGGDTSSPSDDDGDEDPMDTGECSLVEC